MRSKGHFVLVVVLGLAASNCGSPSASQSTTSTSQPITCAWIEGDNCYKEAVLAADTCLPTGTGVLSSDGASCTYQDGAAVSFSPPFAGDAEHLSFTVSRAGTTCLRYSASPDAATITTMAGSVEEDDAQYGVTCPNGTTFSEKAAGSNFGCGSDVFVPTRSSDQAGSEEISVSVMGILPVTSSNPTGAIVLIHCAR